ncbi:MAG: MFS transporter [Burkholderiales bacterium]|jgi:MFS family permease|nr:MFS transporter [Burkholderiales bacterium]
MTLYRVIARYQTFLNQPEVIPILVASVLSRLPIGMLSLSILIYLKDLSGSLAFAGGQVGIYMVAMSVAAPVIGRVIDRFGAVWTLRLCGVIHPLSFWLMLIPAVFTSIHFPLWVITACMIFAGAFCPPTVIVSRAAWRYRFDDLGLRQTAFSVDSVLTELNFVVGPLIVALSLTFFTSTLAFGLAAFAATIAVPIFLCSPACRYVRYDKTVKRHWLGPLTEPRFLWLLAITFTFAITLGSLELAYPAFATQYGASYWGGVLLTFCAIGSAIGGIVYGGVSFKSKHEYQLRFTLLILAVFVAAHILFNSPYLLMICATLAGVVVAPLMTVLTVLQSSYVSERYTAEAFTWSSTCVVSGIGAGMAIGGAIGERFGVTAVFTLSALACVISLLLSLGLIWQAKRAHEVTHG